MEVACYRSQETSHLPLASEEPRPPQAQLIAAQATDHWTRTGTAHAKRKPHALVIVM